MRAQTLVDEDPGAKPLVTRNFLALVLTQTCFGMSFSCFFLMPKFLRQELHASDFQIGTVAALGSLTAVFAFPLIGGLNDRFGRKPFIVLGNALMALTSFLMLHVHEAGLPLYLLRALHGLSFAMVFNSATTLVSDDVAPEKLGQALAVFGSSLLATHALAPALAEVLANRLGWASVFWFAAALAVLAALASLRVTERQKGAADEAGFALLPLLKQPRTRSIVLIIAAAGASFGTMFTFHQPYALSLGMRNVSGFFLAYALSALLSRLWLTSRLEGIERSKLSGWSMLLYALSVLLGVWLRPGVLEAVGAVMGVSQGIFYPVFNALAVDGIDRSQRGSMMALYHGGFNGGIALAVLIGGALSERFGYPALFVGSALVTSVCAVQLLRAPLRPAA